MKKYLVYKVTNLVNGKIYIGCHITEDVNDGYMGSGKRLGYAKKKYGTENFNKEILSIHETPEQMFAEECRLVNEEFLGRDDVYNLTIGGRGGWEYHNKQDKNKAFRSKGAVNSNKSEKKNKNLKYRALRSQLLKQQFVLGVREKPNNFTFLGKTHTDEAKIKISDAVSKRQKGTGNSQHGKCWITNGVLSKSIKKEDVQIWEKLGWRVGRIRNDLIGKKHKTITCFVCGVTGGISGIKRYHKDCAVLV